MSQEILELKNSFFWDHAADDKIYMEKVQIALEHFPFTMRQVFLRFAGGPTMDLSVYDMDRLASTYLKLRGITPIAELGTSKEPECCCDFMVPIALLTKRRS